MNLHRRHLNSGQLAFCGEELEELLAVQAKERQRGGQGGLLLVTILSQAKGEAVEQAAAIVGVSEGYIQQAKKLKASAPDLAEQLLAVQAKERMLAGIKLDPVANLPQGEKGRAAEQAGRLYTHEII